MGKVETFEIIGASILWLIKRGKVPFKECKESVWSLIIGIPSSVIITWVIFLFTR